jgi:hypothetical protein
MISSPLWRLNKRSNRQVEETEKENQKTAISFGSPVWIRFELSPPKLPCDRTLARPLFESDPCELLAHVHDRHPDRHPVWTRLELARSTQDSVRMRRDSVGGECVLCARPTAQVNVLHFCSFSLCPRRGTNARTNCLLRSTACVRG